MATERGMTSYLNMGKMIDHDSALFTCHTLYIECQFPILTRSHDKCKYPIEKARLYEKLWYVTGVPRNSTDVVL